jgi:hypothetical protein
MPDICKDEGNRVLLVEGKNDCHVVLALCNSHDVPKTFGIHECEGADGVLKRLNALILRPGPPEIIGVVLDADNDGVNARWQKIQTKIREHGYLFPTNVRPEGTILEDNPGKPRIGIWLMPNNEDPGILEDFLLAMAGREGTIAASECVAMAKDKGLTSFRENHSSKAVIHTYLAWQDEPGKPLGQAVTSHALEPNTHIAVVFVGWLNRLFND